MSLQSSARPQSPARPQSYKPSKTLAVLVCPVLGHWPSKALSSPWPLAIKNPVQSLANGHQKTLSSPWPSETLTVMVCPVLAERDIGHQELWPHDDGVSSLGGERYRSSRTLPVMVCPVLAERNIGRLSRTLAVMVCPFSAERDIGHQEPWP